MNSYHLDALIISSRDEFLNEYVDKNSSLRIYLSDFTGTAGDLIITGDAAFLLVDGRYHIQAENQIDKNSIQIIKVGIDENGNFIDEYLHERLVKTLISIVGNHDITVGLDPRQFSLSLFKLIKEKISSATNQITLNYLPPSFFDKISPIPLKQKETPIIPIDISITGFSTNYKLNLLLDNLKSQNIDAFLITRLDEVAFLLNLNGSDIDYNSTIKAIMFVCKEDILVFSHANAKDLGFLQDNQFNMKFLHMNTFAESITDYLNSNKSPLKLAFDSSSINMSQYDFFNSFENLELIDCPNNPLKILKSIKTDQELKYIKTCLNKADSVFNQLINWVNRSIQQNKMISEGNIKDKLVEIFTQHKAQKLSFEPIIGIAENSAIVHYTESNYDKILNKNDLVLIDAGAYFEGGYATDLTRTFIAGGKNSTPTDKQKQIYTIVLKSAIKGLTAEIDPAVNNGTNLDTLVRDTVKRYNFNYNHGTGHGIGRLVHEAPPTIGSRFLNNNILIEKMLFTIEPGIYLQGWGGVRIENIVTLVPHKNISKANQGWLQVECLTFADLDQNLIDDNMLNEFEKDFLYSYFQKGKNNER